MTGIAEIMYRFIKTHPNNLKLSCGKYCIHGLAGGMENLKSYFGFYVPS